MRRLLPALAVVASFVVLGWVRADVSINEIRIDQPSDDVDEYVELVGEAGGSLDGLTYVVIGDGEGGSGVIEAAVNLGGSSISSNGFFVAAESTFSLGSANLITDLNFENSDNVTHLLVQGFTGAVDDDLDTDDDGTLDITPWEAILDSVALIEAGGLSELVYSSTVVGPDGSFVPAHVYRCPDGTGEWAIGEFELGLTDTAGATNGDCGPPSLTRIHEIQGSGLASPIVGDAVIVEAIVVGDFQGSEKLNGFFVQEMEANEDTDPATSEGLFVYAPTAIDVTPGDLVRVTGTVAEYLTSSGASSLTELTNVTDIIILSSGNPLPAATELTLPVSAQTDFEAFEGMLVTFPQALAISEFFNFDRYGELVLALPLPGDDRPFQGTAITDPGADALSIEAINLNSRITLDDGSNGQNPPTLRHPNGSPFSLSNRFRGGDTVQYATGVIDERFALYRLEPTSGADYVPENPRPLIPNTVGGVVTVASFNVLNYFTTLDTGPDICGPAANLDCRGAQDEEEFTRQRDKLVDAVVRMDADIVGLIEIENNAFESIADLVSGVNDVAGPGTYAYIDTGTIGTDAIKVGLIYKPASVLPEGAFAILDSTVDPRFVDTKNRPVLAQSFSATATGATFTVAVNHLKSKGSPCDDIGDPDANDGQGNCNGTRTAAAEALVDWLATDPTESGDPDALIIGDLNAYAREDPIVAVTGGADDLAGSSDDYTDLIAAFAGDRAYSYVFDGQWGYLDHALANASLAPQVAGATVWHINADESDVLDYTTRFKPPEQVALYEPNAFRSSDHDPVIVGLNLLPVPEVKGACTDGGWKYLYRDDGTPFKNQGDCIQYVNTGK